MVDKGVPREHYDLVIDGRHGHVTTGMFAPTVESYAAMALVPAESAVIGRELDEIIRDQSKKAKIVKRPFYVPAFRR
jgi:aminomethyltransferase